MRAGGNGGAQGVGESVMESDNNAMLEQLRAAVGTMKEVRDAAARRLRPSADGRDGRRRCTSGTSSRCRTGCSRGWAMR